jgi:uncharacterized membrane protein
MASSLETQHDLSPQSSPRPEYAATSGSTNVGGLDRWLSLSAGGALMAAGLLRRSVASFALVPVGGYLIYRGLARRDPVYGALGVSTADSRAGIRGPVRRSITINQPAREIYAFWRRLENLPQFMQHLVSVSETGPTRSHWVARGPFGGKVSWDAEITEEQDGKLISWQSLPGSQVHDQGSVRFIERPNERGTIVQVTMTYDPPAGPLGVVVAGATGNDPSRLVADALRHLKQTLEAGEIATIDGQPTGKRSLLDRVAQLVAR